MMDRVGRLGLTNGKMRARDSLCDLNLPFIIFYRGLLFQILFAGIRQTASFGIYRLLYFRIIQVAVCFSALVFYPDFFCFGLSIFSNQKNIVIFLKFKNELILENNYKIYTTIPTLQVFYHFSKYINCYCNNSNGGN